MWFEICPALCNNTVPLLEWNLSWYFLRLDSDLDMVGLHLVTAGRAACQIMHYNTACCTKNSFYFSPKRGAKFCDECWIYLFVCLFVCRSVLSHNSKTTRPNFTKFCACCLWPWLDPPLTAFQYVMFFQFYGWHHGASGPESSTTLCLEEEVCSVVVPVGCQTTTVFGWVHRNAALSAKSAIYDCLV